MHHERYEGMKELIEQAKENELDCKSLAKAYSIWLKKLTPANWLLVLGAALLSLVAGASLLVNQGVLTKEAAGVLALISAAFTIIHTKLNCDHHQAECKKLKGSYKGLALEYKNLKSISDLEEYRKKLQSLNDKRALIEENADAEPSKASIVKARGLVESDA